MPLAARSLMPEENSPITAPGATWCGPEFQPWVIDSTETAARVAFERRITQTCRNFPDLGTLPPNQNPCRR
jgi:hypothetical protein